ncbi:EI24 domain-containing protein [Sphingopyxis yananensis]|jgi:CysZ protein|uniref:EI24 domain-containing protein n=1 Tax=Sphingopyxis yananensis TaxID=2886687 RepID=UPI001D1251BD|nr:EI24 domain-containing protein [Sphingopyxis yananensis]MCC2601405.1 EI24 domain-containing protein [Sphingopyxis yananensis]
MVPVLKALLLALRDLPRPHIVRLLLRSIALTMLILVMVGAMLFWGLRQLTLHSGLLDHNTQNMAEILMVLAAIFVMWLLFRGIAIFVIGLFTDQIVEDVEDRHYPAARMTAVPVGYRRSIILGLRSAGRFLGVNIIALPAYLILLPTGVGTPILVLLVNAWLLGHDLEAMVRARHPHAKPLAAPARWGLGLLSAASLSIPVVNFLAPLMSAAMATHLFHLRHEA